MTTPCETCGHALELGEYPFCPHGRGGQNARQTNESFIGGVTIENLGHEPVTVYSREEFKAAMKAANVEQRIHYVPGDKYLTNWAACITAQTLANAKALVERQAAPRVTPRARLPSYRGYVTCFTEDGSISMPISSKRSHEI